VYAIFLLCTEFPDDQLCQKYTSNNFTLHTPSHNAVCMAWPSFSFHNPFIFIHFFDQTVKRKTRKKVYCSLAIFTDPV